MKIGDKIILLINFICPSFICGAYFMLHKILDVYVGNNLKDFQSTLTYKFTFIIPTIASLWLFAAIHFFIVNYEIIKKGEYEKNR